MLALVYAALTYEDGVRANCSRSAAPQRQEFFAGRGPIGPTTYERLDDWFDSFVAVFEPWGLSNGLLRRPQRLRVRAEKQVIDVLL